MNVRPLRVAVTARAVYPLHGLGGLERSVYDLVRHLARNGVQVTVITRPPSAPPPEGGSHESAPVTDLWLPPSGGSASGDITLRFVPYRTFPFAGRRGTTVLDRILGNHSQVVSAGELGDFAQQLRYAADVPGRTLIDHAILDRWSRIDFALVGRRYLEQTRWRAAGTARYVDKLPANFMIAGLIAKALPQAVILHMVRDPMDVCFSNFRALFGDAYGYSYDLDALAAHHRLYARLMRHWHEVVPGRILDVDYQRLAADPEGEARRILDFCRLRYEPGCGDLSRNATPSATLSSAQVREPIHLRGIGAWRMYQRQLQPLAARLTA